MYCGQNKHGELAVISGSITTHPALDQLNSKKSSVPHITFQFGRALQQRVGGTTLFVNFVPNLLRPKNKTRFFSPRFLPCVYNVLMHNSYATKQCIQGRWLRPKGDKTNRPDLFWDTHKIGNMDAVVRTLWTQYQVLNCRYSFYQHRSFRAPRCIRKDHSSFYLSW